MSIKLFFQAIIKFILGVLIVGLLVFIPANTIYYWNGWLFMTLLFVPMFIAGLNYKYNWIILPNIVIIISSILFILAYILYAEVLRENTYLSRTIEIQENQKVIDTGLYGIVRHPMYAITIILFLTMPLILGSILSFVIFFSISNYN